MPDAETLEPSAYAAEGDEQQTDVAIVGAGPVGLFAIFECGMLGFRCHVIDSMDVAGGQIAALYPEKPIYDIPGYPEIEGIELIRRLEEQAAPFRPVYHLGEQVREVTRTEDERWRLTTSGGVRVNAKAIIIAAGVGAFAPNRPPLDDLEAFEDTSVFYMVKRREDFRGKRLVIAGGGDSALDWTNSLAELADKIFLVHRRDTFRGAPESVSQMTALVEAGKVELVVPYQLHALEGEDGQLHGVVVRGTDKDKTIRRLEADTLLPFYGLKAKLGPIAEWGLNLDRNHIVVEPGTCQTNVPGIFAIGDITTYEGKLKLILQGFSEAAVAAHAIHPLLRPDERLKFEYSTAKGVPTL
ncbi:MAG: NAD(P)/FAD-dependent oxidoreductase [Alphaproteobacteria bacterium]|nr:NAD(P)/FAD-dependent oxidoreductase [Alphaproteobacteria bacterium]